MAGASERWNGFLRQIGDRAQKVREEALAASQAIVAQIATVDNTALSNAWSGVESRLQELERMIIDTWHQKVDQAFADEGASGEVRAAAYEQGDDFKFQLENLREALGIHIQAEVARRLWQLALAEFRGRFCPGCGSQIPLALTFRTTELTCGKCGARSTFEPSTLLRGAGASGAHALPQEAVQREWMAMRAADRAARKVRPPCPFALLKAYELAQITYWRAYVAHRAEIEPELGRDPALEVRSRMEPFYQYQAQHEPEWVAAGSPRERI